MGKSLSESQKKNLEHKVLMVESDHFDVLYALDRKGKGMYIIHKDQSIPVCHKDVETFADEIKAVWNHLKGVLV